MDMLDYIKTHKSTLPEIAEAACTKVVYLRQIARGHRKPSHKLARAIESATNGVVTVYDLRPDIFGTSPDTSTKHQQDAPPVQKPSPGGQSEERDQAAVADGDREAA